MLIWNGSGRIMWNPSPNIWWVGPNKVSWIWKPGVILKTKPTSILTLPLSTKRFTSAGLPTGHKCPSVLKQQFYKYRSTKECRFTTYELNLHTRAEKLISKSYRYINLKKKLTIRCFYENKSLCSRNRITGKLLISWWCRLPNLVITNEWSCLF